jgi:hypothetical protein
VKRRLWLRRLSASAPKMSVQSHFSWPLRALLVVIMLGLGGALALCIFNFGHSITGFNPAVSKLQLTQLQEQLAQLGSERNRLSALANSAESRLNIEISAQQQLALQVKAVTAENNRLKEDLAFFESLLPAATGPEGITLRRLKAELVAPNQLHYQLLAMQGGKGERPFAGTLQFAVSISRDGKNSVLLFPDAKAPETGAFRLEFKHYQRADGWLVLPDGVHVKSVQARVLEQGKIRTQQSVNF